MEFPYSPFRGLYDRNNGEIVDAPDAAIALVKSYPDWPTKGLSQAGWRLTLMAEHRPFKVGEDVLVLHVVECTVPGQTMMIMGPKAVYGEYLDGQRQSGEPMDPNYPWVGLYDGAVLPSPELDYNFEISRYTFQAPGRHKIVWRIGGWVSNELEILVE